MPERGKEMGTEMEIGGEIVMKDLGRRRERARGIA